MSRRSSCLHKAERKEEAEATPAASPEYSPMPKSPKREVKKECGVKGPFFPSLIPFKLNEYGNPQNYRDCLIHLRPKYLLQISEFPGGKWSGANSKTSPIQMDFLRPLYSKGIWSRATQGLPQTKGYRWAKGQGRVLLFQILKFTDKLL